MKDLSLKEVREKHPDRRVRRSLPAASSRGTSRRTWSFCRKITPSTSSSSACETRSRARFWRLRMRVPRSRRSWLPVLTCGQTCREYRVYKEGELVDEPTDIRDYWEGDLVSFLIGCSFTFEDGPAGCRPANRAPGPEPERADVRDRTGVQLFRPLLRSDGGQHASL